MKYLATDGSSRIIVEALHEQEAREMADARLDGPVIAFRPATDNEVLLFEFHNEMTAGQESLRLKPGQRIRLIAMVDDPNPLPPGSEGTILAIHDQGDWLQVQVEWDCGSDLMLTVPPDRVVGSSD